MKQRRGDDPQGGWMLAEGCRVFFSCTGDSDLPGAVSAPPPVVCLGVETAAGSPGC